MEEGHKLTAGLLALEMETAKNSSIETRPLVFCWACKQDRVDIARKLVEQGTDMSWKDTSGRTLLHYATEVGFEDEVKLLLANKADADAADKNGHKAIHMAIKQRHMSIAALLVSATHSLKNLPVEYFSQLVHWACKSSLGDTGRQTALVEMKDKSGRTLLHYAAYHGISDEVDLLLANKADAATVDMHGKTAFDMAMKNGHKLQAGQLALAVHTVEDLPVETRPLAFCWACKQKRADIARKVVEQGTDMAWKDKSGRTLLHYAAEAGFQGEVELLLAKNADADVTDKNGNKAVHLAIRQHHMSTACQLVVVTHTLEDLSIEDLLQLVHWVCSSTLGDTARQTALVEMKDKSGCTLLHYSAHHGMGDEVVLLLASKADADAVDKNGNKAVYLAIRQRHMSIAGRLVLATHTLGDLSIEDLSQLVHWTCESSQGNTARQSAFVEMKEKSGRTLLHYAAHHGMCDEVDLLLANKADSDAIDKNRHTAFDLAMKQCQLPVASHLASWTHNLCDSPSEVQSVLLHWACANNRTDVAKKIALKITDMKTKDKDGRTPLDIVAVYDNVDIADILLKWKQHEDDVEMFRTLTLSKDLPLETRDLVLHWACKHDQVDIAEKLIEQGTYVGWKYEHDRTLLHYAAELGFQDVVKVLLAKKADADAADKDGKRPYQLTDGLLRRQLRKAVDEQKYATLYAEGTVTPDIVKVCFIGSEGAGKTTLMEAIKRGWIEWIFTSENQADNPWCEEERTVGINVLTVNIPGVGRLSLWDYAGQRQFHKTHGLFFSATNSVFILVVSLVKGKERQLCSDEELRDEVQYWLSFLRASLDPDVIPTVLVVASRGDRHPNGQRVLQRVVDCMREEFKGKVNISEGYFVLDCRKSKSPQMKQLKKFLGSVKKQFIECGARYPRLCLPVVSKVLPTLRKRQGDPFMETPALIDTIEREACPGQDKKILDKVVDFVHDTGEVVRVRDVTGLNPRWLCHCIIGPLLASDEFPCHMRRKKNDGKVTRSEVEEALRRFFAANNIKVQVSVDLVLALLEFLALAFKVEGEDDTYQFPAHLPVKKLAAMWIRNDAMKVFVGRRQICSSPTSIFSPSAFSLFQCRASITLDRQALLWRDGIIVEKVIEGRSPVQCLSAMTKPLGAVDFRVRGRKGSEHECYSFLQEVISLWNEVVEEYSPGTECETGYLSYLHLCEHREQPAMYTEEAVQQVRAQGPSAFARLSTSDCTMSETLKELMVFPPPDTTSYTSSKVLRAVQKVGSARCYALGQAMGFTIAEVERITHHRVDYADKLLALFSVKGDEVGIEKAEDLLLSACKNIQPAIDKDVKAELDHQ